MINLNYKMYIFNIVAIIFAMTLHEYTKALISKKLGDNTPEKQGRITLNPIKQIEPVGFLIMLLCGYGWSKPMDTNGFFYKDWKKGTIITYITPSIVNLVLGMSFSLSLQLFEAYFRMTFGWTFFFSAFLFSMAKYNIALAIFNMIPIYPMDAHRVLLAFLSPNNRVRYSNYEKIFTVIMMLLLISGILVPVLNSISNIFLF